MSPRVLQAKRRSARRARDAGAVMFIVAMTMAVLAAVGMFALRAASFEARTSGYERQNAQTHYLSDYGVLAASTEISSDKAQFYKDLLLSSGAARDTNCVSLPPAFNIGGSVTSASSASRACRRAGSAELTAGWNNAALTPKGNTNNVKVVDKWTTSAPGSLGYSPIDGDFFVEITDPVPWTLQANTASNLGLCFYSITVTSVGVTTPARALTVFSSSTNDTGFFANEGLEAQRARFIIGPVRDRICASQ